MEPKPNERSPGGEPAPQAQALPSFQLGTRVRLQNLNSEQFNGRLGEIVALPQAGKDIRYDVKLDEEEKPIAVRPQNVVFVSAPPPRTENSAQGEQEALIPDKKGAKPKTSKANSTKAAPPKTTYVMPTFALASRLTLQDMKTEQYNGCIGTVVGFPEPEDAESRYNILVDGHKKPIRIREKNLLPLLKIGTRVKLQNLSSEQFNGRLGEIVALPQPGKDTRYDVKLDGEEKPMAIRAQNLVIKQSLLKELKTVAKTKVDRVKEWRRQKLKE